MQLFLLSAQKLCEVRSEADDYSAGEMVSAYSALTAPHLKLVKYKLIFILMSAPEGNMLVYSVKLNFSLWFLN